MELTELYKLRRNFTIIGLTGRTGSGCSKIAELLSKDFISLEKGLRTPSNIESPIERRKYEICYDYMKSHNNWQKFEVIKYKDILLFYLISYYGLEDSKIQQLFIKHYREGKDDNNQEAVKGLLKKMKDLTINKKTIEEIKSLKGKIPTIKKEDELKKLNDLFFGDSFKDISQKLWSLLEEYGYFRRSVLLHKISCNIRKSGDPLNLNNENDINNIYTLSKVTNRLIKARKQQNDKLQLPTKIVIDSLRNSLEIMFFKERYSGFHMMATKDGSNRTKQRILDRLKSKLNGEPENDTIVNKILNLDSIEYKTSDYSKGKFSSPDVYNCIQKSDIHVINTKLDDASISSNNPFSTREEQILKFISLIQQPGIITPSSSERCMQIAFNAKLNSGCVSRQVGAVVTDINYSVKAIGWNDVPSGQTPCNLRSANDFVNKEKLSEVHYSKFERGVDLDKVDIDFKYKNKEPYNFPEAVKSYFNGSDTSEKNAQLGGRNCTFCFKTIHNNYEGEKNQVHTKSLHAEENAMLQISKYGGQGLKNGILFTTASPCELCSKKATQLGVKKVYYIDPYPGISEPQILTNNRNKDSMELIQFNGVLGKSYVKLYEPFMAPKDEIKIILENSPKEYKKEVNWKKTFDSIQNKELKNKLLNALNDKELDENKLIDLLK
jgi:deoxycytidylate deaminase